MKVLDRVMITLLLILSLVLSATVPILTIASSKNFYQTQLEKTGIYVVDEEDSGKTSPPIGYINGDETKSARFTQKQMDVIIHHIIDYMFTDQESFALTMDDVKINGTEQDNVSIFSEEAVSHMQDVKKVFSLVLNLSIFGGALLLVCVLYICLRWNETASLLLKYFLIFYGVFIGICLLFCGLCFLQSTTSDLTFTNLLWRNLHYVFFPMQGDKIAGSFFNDALTCILTLDFFLGAVKIVLTVMGVTFGVSFLVSLIAKIKSNSLE